MRPKTQTCLNWGSRTQAVAGSTASKRWLLYVRLSLDSPWKQNGARLAQPLGMPFLNLTRPPCKLCRRRWLLWREQQSVSPLPGSPRPKLTSTLIVVSELVLSGTCGKFAQLSMLHDYFEAAVVQLARPCRYTDSHKKRPGTRQAQLGLPPQLCSKSPDALRHKNPKSSHSCL